MDTSGDASGGVEVAVLNPDRLGVDLDLRITLGQLGGEGPVGSDWATIQQSGVGQQKRARANRAHTAALGCRLPQPLYSCRVGLSFLNTA